MNEINYEIDVDYPSYDETLDEYARAKQKVQYDMKRYHAYLSDLDLDNKVVVNSLLKDSQLDAWFALKELAVQMTCLNDIQELIDCREKQ